MNACLELETMVRALGTGLFGSARAHGRVAELPAGLDDELNGSGTGPRERAEPPSSSDEFPSVRSSSTEMLCCMLFVCDFYRRSSKFETTALLVCRLLQAAG